MIEGKQLKTYLFSYIWEMETKIITQLAAMEANGTPFSPVLPLSVLTRFSDT